MKKIVALLGFILPVFVFGQVTAHQFSVSKIEGGTVSLSSFSGKKVLIITLPIVQSVQADSLLFSLDSLSAHRATQLQVIAVPAFEDGYTVSGKTALLAWYRSKLGGQVIITDGLYTRLSTGSGQHPLFNWMTDITQNEVFGIDSDGPGYKFIINESGGLVGVLRAHSKMWGQSIQQALSL